MVKGNVDIGAARKVKILPCRIGGKNGMLKVNFKIVGIWMPGRNSGGTFQNPA